MLSIRAALSALILFTGFFFQPQAAMAAPSCNSLFLRQTSATSSKVFIGPDEVGIFGYGSLLNVESMSRTLGRPYTGAVVPAALNGWKRTWDSKMPNESGKFHAITQDGIVVPKHILYLNVRASENSHVNGMIFVIKKSEMAQFNLREYIYDPVDVTASVTRAEVFGGSVYTYVGKAPYLANKDETFPEVGLRRSYFEIVRGGLREFDTTFQKEFFDTTAEMVPQTIFQDVMN